MGQSTQNLSSEILLKFLNLMKEQIITSKKKKKKDIEKRLRPNLLSKHGVFPAAL